MHVACIADVIEPRLVKSVKQCRDPFSGPQRIRQITGSGFPISFHPDWQIHKGFFNRQIMACTQLLSWYPGGVSEQDFGAVSQTDLTRVLEFCLWSRLLYISLIFCVEIILVYSESYSAHERRCGSFTLGYFFVFFFLITAHNYTTLPNGGQTK